MDLSRLAHLPIRRLSSENQASSSSRLEEIGGGLQINNVLFREIHKNAWLKRFPSSEKKLPKKSAERVWAVFCVHDDAEPLLELYNDQQQAAAHRPPWAVSLSNCLHVSPTLCAHEHHYEFVITLSEDVVKLAAPSWELMMEWVDTIGTKLREMSILAPKENVYSRLPEARLPLAPTRDPTSPLPPPPQVPAGIVPGIEILETSSQQTSSPAMNTTTTSATSSVIITNTLSSSIPTSLEGNNESDLIVTETITSPSNLHTTSLYISHVEESNYSRSQSTSASISTLNHSSEDHSASSNVTVIEVPDYDRVFDFNSLQHSLPRDRESPVDAFFTPPSTPQTNSIHTSSLYERVFLPSNHDPLPPAPPPSADSLIQSSGNSPFRRRRTSSESNEQSSQPPPLPPPASERRLQPPPSPFRQLSGSNGGESPTNGRLTLREQQVLALRREMMHPGGVRLQLRRHDCRAIALVDAFGAVWVAGWKQREHPMLYNALHIGDQVISICGVAATTASEAHRLVRLPQSLYAELIVRRVPLGRVYAIRRAVDGQPLGIEQMGGTAEIRNVASGGLASRAGLPPKATTADGLGLTTWALTEINGRPLNLCFKENEIRDRLNAVGRDISILVQPYDLVRQLKKQLKALRSYKDYIVQ